jgi:hypothetical protein
MTRMIIRQVPYSMSSKSCSLACLPKQRTYRLQFTHVRTSLYRPLLLRSTSDCLQTAYHGFRSYAPRRRPPHPHPPCPPSLQIRCYRPRRQYVVLCTLLPAPTHNVKSDMFLPVDVQSQKGRSDTSGRQARARLWLTYNPGRSCSPRLEAPMGSLIYMYSCFNSYFNTSSPFIST